MFYWPVPDNDVDGPILAAEDVRPWIAQESEVLSVVDVPSEIHIGWWAILEDLFGGRTYLIDHSTGEPADK